MTRQDAFEILYSIGATDKPDFFTLSSDQIDTLLERAKAFKYRHPKNANGSKARYFYAYVSRLASKKLIRIILASVTSNPGIVEGLGQFRASHGAIVTDWCATKELAITEYWRAVRELGRRYASR